MVRRGLVEPPHLRRYADDIAPQLYRSLAIDPATFRRRVEERVRSV